MNSQFSIGFAIALIIGIAVGALWPKYGVAPGDAALSWGQDAQEVNFAQAIGRRGGRGDNFEDSGNGHAGRGVARGHSGRGQGGRGCSGDCEDSGNGHAGRGVAHGSSGRGQGKATCSSKENFKKTLTSGRPSCDESGHEPIASVQKTEAQSPAQRRQGREHDIDNSIAKHRGSGRGAGLGLGLGWGRDFEMADVTNPDEKPQAAEKE